MKTNLAIITGGSKGIGEEIVKRIANKMDVLCIARNPFPDTQENDTYQIHSLQADFSDPNQAIKDLDEWLNTHPDYQVKYLIHNAATLALASTREQSYGLMTEAFNVNTFAPMQITQHIYQAGRFIQGEERSSVLYVTSSAAREGVNFMEMDLYSSSKAALNKMASIQKREFEEIVNPLNKMNVVVHRIYPGVVDTQMQRLLREQVSAKDASFKSKIGALNDYEPGCWHWQNIPQDDKRTIQPKLSAKFIFWAAKKSIKQGHPNDEFDFYTEDDFHQQQIQKGKYNMTYS